MYLKASSSIWICVFDLKAWYDMCRRDGVERQTTSRFLNEAQFHSQVWVWDQPTAFGGAICRWWLCARATIGSILYVVVCSVRTLPFNSPSSFSICTLPAATSQQLNCPLIRILIQTMTSSYRLKSQLLASIFSTLWQGGKWRTAMS